MTCNQRVDQRLSSLVSLVTAISLTLSLADRALTQIVPDSTLGVEGSVMNPNGNIQGLPADLIEGGAIRGVNLFHSFSEFNIGDGQRVYFVNPTAIETIFSRVTGSNQSNILGTLGVLGNANLFLLNPNGIIFGPNAQLDIRGSFTASTANRFTFPDGSEFSATHPQAPPLLTINVPIGLQYGSQQPKATLTNSGNLTVGENLTLAADTLDLQGQLVAGGDLTLQAEDTVQVRDRATHPFIASAGGQLLIQGNQTLDIVAWNHPDSGFFSGGDMVLRSANRIGGDAHYSSGGNFRVETLDGSPGSLFSPKDPIILATGDVTLAEFFGASLHILAGGSVTLGSIFIETTDAGANTINPANPDPFLASLANVTLSDGTPLTIDGSNTATLDVRAGIDWSLLPNFPGTTGIGIAPPPSATATSADITIGDIVVFDLNTGNGGIVFLTNQFLPNLSLPTPNGITVDSIDTRDLNGGGAAIIDAGSSITLNGGSGGEFITSAIDTSPFFGLTDGNGGDITLLAEGDIRIQAPIISDGLLSGTITLTLEGNIYIEENLSSRNFGSDSSTTGGDITITANSFFATEAALSTRSIGNANAGNVSIAVNDTVSLEGGGIFSETQGQGRGGDVDITASVVSLTNTKLDSLTLGQGDGGDVVIEARDRVSFDGGTVQSRTLGGGKGGTIDITAPQLYLTNNAFLDSSTSATGDAGDVTVQARELVSLDNGAGVFSRVETNADGNGGDIIIGTGELTLTNGAFLDASTLGEGDAGNIVVDSRSLFLDNEAKLIASTSREGNAGDILVQDADSVSLDNSSISTAVNAGATGEGGKIELQTGTLTLNNGAFLSASTSGEGSAGSILVQDADSVSLDNSSISTAVNQGAVSTQPSNIEIQSGSISLTNNAQINASTSGTGDAGRILVENADLVSLDNSSISTAVNAGAMGEGGKIELQTGTLSLNNNAQITASTAGQGNAGDILVQNADVVSLDSNSQINASTSAQGNTGQIVVQAQQALSLANDSQISTAVEAGAVGNSEEIILQTRSLSLNNAQISAATSGEGDAGSILVQDAESVSLDNSSISTAVNQGAVATQPSDIAIQSGSVLLRNNAQINASTSGTGDAGSILVQDAEAIVLDNSSISTAVNAGAMGEGGKIELQTRILSLNNNAQISASTAGEGNAGSINLTTDQITIQNGSQISAATTETAGGWGGSISVRGNTFKVANGGQLRTTTAGSQNAGDITLIIQDNINLSGAGSGLFANTTPGSTGNGGSIFVDPRIVTIQDGAGIAVDSQGTGTGGNIELQAGSLSLENQAFISAETASNTGGDINLQVQSLLVLRHGSKISTTAGTAQAGGDGGNITINAPFIFAIPAENSDITANAFEGRGGTIKITTQGILGLEFRDRLTPLSDITASSEFGVDGVVEINNPEVDPTSGLINLPTNLVDATRLVAQNCSADKVGTTSQLGEFVITGRGGLPSNPNELLNSEILWQDWRLLNDESTLSNDEHPPNHSSFILPNSAIPPMRQIVEAQGWVKKPDGTVMLVAQTPSVTPYSSGLTFLACQGVPSASAAPQE
ncbi:MULTISPECIES: filamentous hemagglutinin N-terminal domain-containing protein [unclassified Coleofasciculus]|uniref:two-partner secretion domain-containing protein n=1 Tax=unclassified Coleofasciculus TaxID=2692782 RepID=UPI00187FC059|nr:MULTISPECIES: filamentous hemagglutinin N-terminal domain-containing protein [unclassified Coleofasciculus]MBE9127123.1 filamentous hemagglutinin N-terminal domain-containing protein [Coleofasciculus sp. LEGE 07081]MBE9149770.1 filamentous hemagglutinin N-terminal domain-containing protein [Coleofasciculus sp. LEGE 07092]